MNPATSPAVSSGIASCLVRSCILHVSKVPGALSKRKKSSLNCEFGRFKLWAHGFDSTPGQLNDDLEAVGDQLDDVLEHSEYLKRPTMFLLSSFASCLLTRQFRGGTMNPIVILSCVTHVFADSNLYYKVGDDETCTRLNNALQDVVEVYPNLQEDFCDFCSDQSQGSIVEELHEIIDSLFALAPSLNDVRESLHIPAPTNLSLFQLSESQKKTVSIIETYKNFISDKFPNASRNLILRFAEGNAECHEQLRARVIEEPTPIDVPKARLVEIFAFTIPGVNEVNTVYLSTL